MAKIVFNNNKVDKQKTITIQSKPETVENESMSTKEEKVLVNKSKFSFVDKTKKHTDAPTSSKPKVIENVIKKSIEKVVNKSKLSFVDKSTKPVAQTNHPVVFKKEPKVEPTVEPKVEIKTETPKVIESPIPSKPILSFPQPKLIQVDPKIKITECPFKEGDLIKFKDEIYLVNKNINGQFYIFTDSVMRMKQLKPEDWGIYNKIS
jgi:hypothetical protein